MWPAGGTAALRPLLLAVVFAAPAFGDGYRCEPLADPPPAEVADAVRGELAVAGQRILHPDGKPFLDVWLRTSLAPADAPADVGVTCPFLPPGLLVGTIRVHGAASDFRGNRVKAGVYTLRYAIQPQDGDHQGVSETRDFLLLAPAAADASPEVLSCEEIVKLSTKVTGKKHPAVLHLAAPSEGDKASGMSHDEAADRWHFQCALPRAGGGDPLPLRICVAGKAAE